MTDDVKSDPPCELDDGLVVRWANLEDAESVAAFNIKMHSDDENNPEKFLGHWTRDLMQGRHPTTSASDFTVVVDPRNDNRIVSTVGLIAQTWSYDGIEFGCGRPELIATDPDYRRRGLIRRQMAAIHAKSDERGDLAQAILGIPWYYRQFGYEMALNMGGSRDLFWDRSDKSEPQEDESFVLRTVTAEDIPVLDELYQSHCAGGMITMPRDEALWQYELTRQHPENPASRDIRMVETASGEPVAYVEYKKWGRRLAVRELGVKAGHSWRPVCLFLVRTLKAQVEAENGSDKERVSHISFALGPSHPVYEALGRQLEKQAPSYAWYIRMANLRNFLRRIQPVLEARLQNSVLVGHSGTARMNLIHDHLELCFEHGALTRIGSYKPKEFEDGDTLLPDLTFLQLLFGRRSLAELNYARADSYTKNAETEVLLNILFPKRPSQVVALG